MARTRVTRRFVSTSDIESELNIGKRYYIDRAPTSSDNKAAGYNNGDVWIDTVNKEVYKLLDEDAGEWVETTLTEDEVLAVALRLTDGNAFRIVDPGGTDADRGQRLYDAIDAAGPGDYIYAFPEMYSLPSVATLTANLIVFGASAGKRLSINSHSILLDTTGVVEGIDWTSSATTGARWVFTSNATKEGTLRYCDLGTGEDWMGNTNNYKMEYCTAGPHLCALGTNNGKVYNCNIGDNFAYTNNAVIEDSLIGDDFCMGGVNNGDLINSIIGANALMSGTNYGQVKDSFFSSGFCGVGGGGPGANNGTLIRGDFGYDFCVGGEHKGTAIDCLFADSAVDLVSRLGVGGSYLKSIDNSGHGMPIPMYDLGTQSGNVAVDGRIAQLQTITVGSAGITDLSPTGMEQHSSLVRIDNTGDYSVALPLAGCPGTVYKVGEIPAGAVVFDVQISADGNDWYITIGNDWEAQA